MELWFSYNCLWFIEVQVQVQLHVFDQLLLSWLIYLEFKLKKVLHVISKGNPTARGYIRFSSKSWQIGKEVLIMSLLRGSFYHVGSMAEPDLNPNHKGTDKFYSHVFTY